MKLPKKYKFTNTQDSGLGNCDGRFGHTKYFSAAPCSSVFVTADKLILLDMGLGNRMRCEYDTRDGAIEDWTMFRAAL